MALFPRVDVVLQDLWMHQQDSTWGRLLLSGLPQSDWPAEFERMAATAESIQADFRHAMYQGVANVPQHEIEAAAAAAAAATETAGCSSSGASRSCGGSGSCSGSSAWLQRQRQRRNTSSSDIQPEQDTAAAAPAGTAEDAMALDVDVTTGSSSLNTRVLSRAAAAHLRLSSLKQGLQQAQQEQQALQRHMVDRQLLPWFNTPSLIQCTGAWTQVPLQGN
jgi:hypothetical protein